MVNPKPKSRAPSVTQDCPAALVVVWQYAAPDVTRNTSGRRRPVGVGVTRELVAEIQKYIECAVDAPSSPKPRVGPSVRKAPPLSLVFAVRATGARQPPRAPKERCFSRLSLAGRQVTKLLMGGGACLGHTSEATHSTHTHTQTVHGMGENIG